MEQKSMEKPADQQRVSDSSAMPQRGDDRAEQPAPGPADGADQPRETQGINPRNVNSMPRAEDDEVTRDNSPEYHDGRDRFGRDDQAGRDPGRTR
jgi:hypothetical protein